jgi:hypothetical protein
MNCSTAARVAISVAIVAAGCGRAAPAPAAAQPSEPAHARRITPEELRPMLPPRLQGPDGPYTKRTNPTQ